MVFDQLNQLKTATTAATARPYGTDTGPGGIYVAPGPADTTGELMWLRMFLNTFEIVLDALSSKMSDAAERKLKDLEEEENRRRLNNISEDSVKRKAGDVDSERLPSSEDDPRSRVPVDEDPESRIKNVADAEDTSRLSSVTDDPQSRAPVDDNPESRIKNVAASEDTSRLPSATDDPRSRAPVDDNPESRIRNAADAEDTRRLPSATDDPRSRVPVDENPESRIKNAVAAEDTSRLKASIDNVSAVDDNPESRIKNVAAAEDTRRLPSTTDDPRSRVPVDNNPETRIKTVTASEDTSRLKASFDNVSAVDDNSDSRIKNVANAEDATRLPSVTDDPQSRAPVNDSPESRIKNVAAAEDMSRLKASFDNVSAVDDNPELRIKNVAATEDTSRLPSVTDDPQARAPVSENPEMRIKNVVDAQDNSRILSVSDDPDSRAPVDPEKKVRIVADAEDTSRLPAVSDDTQSRVPVDENPEGRIKNAADAEDKTRAPLFDDKIESVSDSKIKAVVERLDLKSEGARARMKNMFKRLAAASTISTDIVEGRAFGTDGRVRPLSENPNAIKYDSKAAGAFGAGPSTECRQTPIGRAIIAGELSDAEIRARRTPRGTMIKSAALRAAGIAAEAVGAVGDVMDFLQIVQVLGNGAFYDPECNTKPATCKFPTEFLTANQAKDISQLAVKKQIDVLKTYTPQNPDFKPQFPLIRGPLDVLSDDPYQNQTLIQLQVDVVQNRILNGDPWRSKFVTYFGSQTVIDDIVNDPEDGLSYYTAKVGMTNAEIDSVYETAFTAVCLQNKGKVWKDTYSSGRPRMQCGFTAVDCDRARRQYFTPRGKGNYVEWYSYTDVETLLAATPRLAPALNFTSKPSDEDGFCMVASPGTAALCSYYKGEYDGSTHKCQFTPAYCQSIGTCFNDPDKMCYLPGPEMEALNFFFAGGGVREWIKVNGCTFVGTDAQKAEYAALSTLYTFMPITMLFTPNGRRMFQDVIANSRNWGPGIKAQLNDPMVGVSFAGAVVGLATMAAAGAASAGLLTGATAAAATGIGLPVAGLILLATGITLAVTMVEAQEEKDTAAKVDKEDFAFQGLQKVVVSSGASPGTYYIPTSRGYADGWVTRKLPVTKKADGTLCTAVENYRNPTTCYEVASTADNPHVYETNFALKVYRKVTSEEAAAAFFTSTVGADLSQIEVSEFDYSKKTQCWKYDYNVKRSDGTTTIENFTTGVSGVNPSSYGQPYGTIETTMHDKIFNGLIRAGTSGSTNKTWCMKRRPDAVMFDATIGTPAVETEYSMNRSWTSKMGDAGLYYPEYPNEAAVLSAKLHNHFRYQLVYAKDSIPQTTMWDNLLMEAIFTESTIAEIRRYYCEQQLIKFSSDTAQIDKRCYGYLSLGLSGYTWFAMSLPGKVSSSFNTINGTVTMGIPTQDNRDTKCSIKYGANFEEDSKGLCYLNCNYGTGATSDSYAYVSREWKSDSSSMCYKQYPKWEENGRGHGEQTITKKIVTADWKGTPNSCPADKEVGGALCYKKCSSLSPGLDTTKYEYLNDGSTQCYKHDLAWETEASRKGRPAGTGSRTYSTMNKPLAFSAKLKGLKTNGVCPAGYQNVGGICYTNCNSDQTGVGPTCFNNNCPSGTTEKTAGFCTDNCRDNYSWDETACYKNCNSEYYRSSLGFCQQSCGAINYQGLTAPTRQITAGVCSAYNFSCPSSYDAWGDGSSTPTCFRPYKQETKSSYDAVVGQACANVCRCDSSRGYSSDGATCRRPEIWSTGCSSYLCCF
jgi:hypothetical protein